MNEGPGGGDSGYYGETANMNPESDEKHVQSKKHIIGVKANQPLSDLPKIETWSMDTEMRVAVSRRTKERRFENYGIVD